MSRPGGSVFRPALLLGAGLGGFVDGIMLHQILRWHHLLSGERWLNSRRAASAVPHCLVSPAISRCRMVGVTWA